MKELINNAKEHANRCKQNSRFWCIVASISAGTYILSYFISMFIFFIKYDLTASSANPVTTSGNFIPTDCNISTTEYDNFASCVNVTKEDKRLRRNYLFRLWNSNNVPVSFLMMESYGILGEMLPPLSGILAYRNLVAFGPKPSIIALCCLVFNLFYHFVHFVRIVTFHRSSIATFDFVWLALCDVLAIICNIILRYACTKIYILITEEEIKRCGIRPEDSASTPKDRDRRRWNWYYKGIIFVSLFHLVMFCVIVRLIWVNVVEYKDIEDRISPAEQLWILPLSSLVLFYLELVTYWMKDGIPLSEMIICKKRFVAFGQHQSKSAWTFLLINILFTVFHSLTAIWSYWNFNCLQAIDIHFLLLFNAVLIVFNVTTRHSFSKFYSFTSEEKRIYLIKVVKYRKIKKIEDETTTALKKATTT